MSELTIKERLLDLLNRNGVFLEEDDDELYELGDMIFDIGDLLAQKIEQEEPYATESSKLLREGGRAIQRHLGYLADGADK